MGSHAIVNHILETQAARTRKLHAQESLLLDLWRRPWVYCGVLPERWMLLDFDERVVLL